MTQPTVTAEDRATCEAFDILCHKYVQRADDRQRSMGLQYTTAETHDLAKFVASQVLAERKRWAEVVAGLLRMIDDESIERAITSGGVTEDGLPDPVHPAYAAAVATLQKLGAL